MDISSFPSYQILFVDRCPNTCRSTASGGASKIVPGRHTSCWLSAYSKSSHVDRMSLYSRFIVRVHVLPLAMLTTTKHPLLIPPLFGRRTLDLSPPNMKLVKCWSILTTISQLATPIPIFHHYCFIHIFLAAYISSSRSYSPHKT